MMQTWQIGIRRLAFATTLGLLLSSAAGAHGGHDGPAKAAGGPARAAGGAAGAWAKMLDARAPLAVAAAFDRDGRLWRAQVNGGHIELQSSADGGRSFAAPVRVNARQQHIAAHGEDRPKLLFADAGAILVGWTENLASPPFATHAWLARSDDGGRSFAPPVRVNSDDRAISHAFVEFAVAGTQVWAVWLDRRDHADARARGDSYRGTALYTAVSDDGGRSFGANRKLADHSCECCRLAVAGAADGVPLVLWRQVFAGGVRDHALARLDADAATPPRRATDDGWQADACPHHGASLASAGGRLHLAWFTGAADRAGLYYRHGDAQGFGPPLAIGDPDNQPSNPQVLARGDQVALVWKEFDGQRSLVRGMSSADAGLTWSAARTLAASAGKADHPQLLAGASGFYLSWNTAADGYRLVGIEAAGAAQ